MTKLGTQKRFVRFEAYLGGDGVQAPCFRNTQGNGGDVEDRVQPLCLPLIVSPVACTSRHKPIWCDDYDVNASARYTLTWCNAKT